MDLEFSAEQELLRETVRRYLDDHAPVTPYVRDMLDSPRGYADQVWRGLAEMGLQGLLVDTGHGGTGHGMVEVGVVLEELGRTVQPGPYISCAVGAATMISILGSPEDQAADLPGLADGSRVAALALFEPDRYGSWDAPATRAFRTETGWRVTGSKTWVPDGVDADLLLVTATIDDSHDGSDETHRDDRAHQIGVFVVGPRHRRVGVEPITTVDGTRRFAEITFDRAPARLIGAGAVIPTDTPTDTDADADWDTADLDRRTRAAIRRTIDLVTLAYVVDGVGTAARALDMAVEYAKQRHQFGKPIGSFQAVQHLCADMLHDLEIGRAQAYYALWAADAADAAECHRAVVMAKAFTSDAFAAIGESAIQVFGGVGFTWEHDIHLYFKRLLTLQHLYGGTTDHLEALAAALLD